MFEKNMEKEKIGLGDEIAQSIEKLGEMAVLEVRA